MTRVLGRIRPHSAWLAGALPVGSFSAAVILLSLLAAIPLSPVTPPSPAGVQAPAPLRLAVHFLGLDRLTPGQTGLLAIAAMAASGLSFLGIVTSAYRGHLSTRLLLMGALPLYALVIALPPLFSHDPYAYGMYGRIAAVYDSNPYISSPDQFPNDPMLSLR